MIVQTLHQFSSPHHAPGVYHDDYLVGTFTYDLTDLSIVSAVISGRWGNCLSATSAHNELWIDNIIVADTYDYSPDPYYNNFVPWSYEFPVSEFPTLADGIAEFHTIQTSNSHVRLGCTTLTIEAVPEHGTPEPATICLLAIGSLVFIRKNK
jgi:hypothetical protein